MIAWLTDLCGKETLLRNISNPPPRVLRVPVRPNISFVSPVENISQPLFKVIEFRLTSHNDESAGYKEIENA